MKELIVKYKGLCVLLVAVILAVANYLIYPLWIKKDMGLVEVPIANQVITQGMEIRDDMIDTILINPQMLPVGIRYGEEKPVVGYYVKQGYTIAKNGFFYSDSLSTKQTSLGAVYSALSEQEAAFTIQIDAQYNQNNTLQTGQKNDIYYSAEYVGNDGTKRYLVGKLKESARIIDVVQEEGKTYITLALQPQEIAIFLIAQKTGSLTPVVTSFSDGSNSDIDYYDVSRLHAWLMSRHQVMYEINMPS